MYQGIVSVYDNLVIEVDGGISILSILEVVCHTLLVEIGFLHCLSLFGSIRKGIDIRGIGWNRNLITVETGLFHGDSFLRLFYVIAGVFVIIHEHQIPVGSKACKHSPACIISIALGEQLLLELFKLGIYCLSVRLCQGVRSSLYTEGADIRHNIPDVKECRFGNIHP